MRSRLLERSLGVGGYNTAKHCQWWSLYKEAAKGEGEEKGKGEGKGKGGIEDADAEVPPPSEPRGLHKEHLHHVVSFLEEGGLGAPIGAEDIGGQPYILPSSRIGLIGYVISYMMFVA